MMPYIIYDIRKLDEGIPNFISFWGGEEDRIALIRLWLDYLNSYRGDGPS